MLKHYQNEDFNELTKNKVLIDFYATWCGPCKMLTPILEELAKEVDIDLIKVDVDEYEELARINGVMSVPTLILFENNTEIKRNIGFISKEKLLEFISK